MPGIGSIVNPFTVNQFMEQMLLPFDRWHAKAAGGIDSQGNILDRNRLTAFEWLVLKIRQWLSQLCPGVTRQMLGSYPGMFSLMSEEAGRLGIPLDRPQDPSRILLVLESVFSEHGSVVDMLMEDMTSGGAGLATPMTGPAAGGVLGFDAPIGTTQKRKVGPSLGDLDVFDIETEEEIPEFKASQYYKRLRERAGKRKFAVRVGGKIRFI